MDETEAVAWLGRKIAWGLTRAEQDQWYAAGPDGVLDLLLDADGVGVAPRPDPFRDVEIDPENLGQTTRSGVVAWMDHALVTPRPLETFMEFFWMDYFAVSVRTVRPPWLVFDYMNLLARHALGNFGDLLREVTVDPAMLVFLDGASSTGGNPNENYGRELLELYSVGVGNHTEDDVQAAAIALTGWIVNRDTLAANLVPRRHDDRPQVLLGVPGVHDVDTVIDAVLAHPATAERVVEKLALAILGPTHDPDLRVPLANSFGSDYELRPLVRSLLELAVDGAATPAIVEPFPWYVMARKTTGATAQMRELQSFFRAAGQVPLSPPNVGGFPEPGAYLSTSATIARFNLAAHLAARNGARAAASEAQDLDATAARFCLPNGFSPATAAALAPVEEGVDRLAAALASPDLAVA